jgi:transcriptional pleiotropic regulator of transition state genes
MEIFVDGDKIILKKYQPGCFLCGNVEDNIEYKGKMICKDCLENMQEKSA